MPKAKTPRTTTPKNGATVETPVTAAPETQTLPTQAQIPTQTQIKDFKKAAPEVRKNIIPAESAALIVASQMGIWGTGKSSRSRELMTQACEAICGYLDSLKP